MREILFRGKDYTGEWVYGNLIVDEDGDAYIIPSKNVIKDGHHLYFDTDRPLWVDKETVCEFTGMADKFGTKIFERDIVEMPCYGRGVKKSEVYFARGKFAVDGSNYSYKDINTRRMKDIGNIYDNPELQKR